MAAPTARGRFWPEIIQTMLIVRFLIESSCLSKCLRRIKIQRLRFLAMVSVQLRCVPVMEVKVVGSNSWTTISPKLALMTEAVCGPDHLLDLSAFAGQNIQIAFHFNSSCCAQDVGWSIDDVTVVTG